MNKLEKLYNCQISNLFIFEIDFELTALNALNSIIYNFVYHTFGDHAVMIFLTFCTFSCAQMLIFYDERNGLCEIKHIDK